jgi:F0F1-type ATP synthase membrane subunit c/vacuolar-type H+-ATPase subunit K
MALESMAYIGAAIAVGVSGIGAGLAIAYSGSSASRAIAQKPELFSKSLIFVALAEAVAIYGLLMGFMILSNTTASPMALLSAGLVVALGGLGASIGIAMTGSAANGALSERPELFSKALIFVALAEAVAIYGLLMGFMILS